MDQNSNVQVDAMAVIDAMAMEIAALTKRAVIAEQQIAMLTATNTQEEL
jgi:hypothetical protein